jgi:hypothetical protein
MIALAVASGLLSLSLNVAYGYQDGLPSAIAYGLADGAKITTLLAAGLYGWNFRYAIAVLVCGTISLFSIANVYMNDAGAALLNREHAAAVQESSTRLKADLEARIRAADAAADSEATSCKNPKTNCRGPNWLALTNKADELRKELAAVNQRWAASEPVQVSGAASYLAKHGYGQIGETASNISVIKTILFLIGMEIIVWFAIPGMGFVMRAKAPSIPVVEVTIEPPTPPALPKPQGSGTRDYYLARLERDYPAIAARVSSGQLSVYAASVQAGIRRRADQPKKRWTSAQDYA